jgi:hypothetical protein
MEAWPRRIAAHVKGYGTPVHGGGKALRGGTLGEKPPFLEVREYAVHGLEYTGKAKKREALGGNKTGALLLY